MSLTTRQRPENHIRTRDARLETVMQDIIRHFLGRGIVGNARSGHLLQQATCKRPKKELVKEASIDVSGGCLFSVTRSAALPRMAMTGWRRLRLVLGRDRRDLSRGRFG